MEVEDCVLSAGRAVLDMVEREWQPLAPGELEQQLDQAVEETLEAELVARLKSQPSPTIYVHLLQSPASLGPQVPQSTPEEELQEPRALQPPVDGEALKVPPGSLWVQKLFFQVLSLSSSFFSVTSQGAVI